MPGMTCLDMNGDALALLMCAFGGGDITSLLPLDVGASTSRRQVSFLFECFGEVARATSLPDETVVDFTTAAELRRLSLE